MKKVLSKSMAWILSVMMMFSTVVSSANILAETSLTVSATETQTYGDYNYTVNSNNTVTITKYIGSGKEAIIPSAIDGKKVTTIGDYAFYECTGLTSITIPNSVASIGYCAFEDCTGLTSIVIPNSVTSIGTFAFGDCKNLTSIVIPDSVTKIEDSAFYGCSNLTIYGNKDSYAATYAKNNNIPFKNILSDFEYTTNDDNTITITKYIGSGTEVVIPDKMDGKNVTSIGWYAFSDCSSLTSIVLPNGVTSIRNYAFYKCTGLTSIIIPNSVTSIGNDSFRNCSNLTSINVDTNNSTYSSENGVLFNKSKTEIITCPEGKKGAYVLPKNVKSIGSNAFVFCTGLTSITIPNSVTSIRESTFWTCTGLTSIDIDTDNSIYSSENGILFNKNKTTIITCPAGKKGTYTLPNSVISIGDSAFCNCTGLTSITIPNSVTSIGEHAFYGCKNLTIYGNKDSYAETYANEHNIPFVVLEENPEVAVTGVKLNKTSLTLEKGKSETLTATITPSNATNKTVTWTTSNSSVATVSNGKVTAVSAGTATITAKSNNGKTATCKVTVTPKPKKFIDGADNWSFSNSRSNFGNTYYMNDNYWNKLLDGLSNTEKATLIKYVKNGYWGGSCYGMASTSILANNDILKPSTYQTGANFLHDISKPPTNEVKSLINYYFSLQYTDVIQQQICKNFYSNDEKAKLQSLLNCLEDGSPTLLCFHGYFYGYSWSGHAVVAYGVEYGTYSYNRKAYNGKILIYDNNNINYDDDFCLYFNSSDGSWIIPYYELDSNKKSILGFISDDMKYINYHGYLNGTSDATVSDYIAVLHSAALSSNYKITKASLSNGIWTSTTTSDDDIKVFSSFADTDFEKCDLMFAMKDASSGYIMKTSSPEKLDLSLSYENSLLMIEADNGQTARFSPNGCIEVNGNNISYKIKMTYNSDYPTDWYAIQVNGSNSDNASLRKAQEGYVLSADDLKNVNIEAKNEYNSASRTFSTNYDSVLIYEINENTIGLKVDTDGNGTYETDITNQATLKNNSVLSATEINLGDTVTVTGKASGGTAPYKYAVYYKASSSSTWSTKQDFSTNTSVSIKPATATTYEVCVKVKDKDGNVEKKYFTVKVTNNSTLVNNSTISATSIKLGNSVNVKCTATGGTTPYKYAVFYKQSAQSKWTVKQDFSTNTSVSIKPATATTYEVCVKVKDKDGTVEKKYFTVKVTNNSTLVNNSTISATSIKLGNSVSVKCTATGGTTPYKYAVLYKQSAQSKWTIQQDFSTNTSVSIKPATATTYEVCVKVKDKDGTVEKKYFTVKVTNNSTLVNNSTISATSIKLGNSVSVKCTATGGTTPYKYAVLYKQSAQSKWTIQQDFSTNTSVSIKPATATTYDICVKVKDNQNNVVKKYFTITVK